jgi:surface antigen
MTPGHQQHWVETQYDVRDLAFENLALDVEPADRVGAPLPNRRRAKLRRLFIGFVLVAGAWAFIANDLERAHGLAASAVSFLDAAVAKAREIASRPAQENAPVAADASNASASLLPPIAPPAPIEPNTGSEFSPGIAPTQGEKTAPAAGEEISTGSVGTAYIETSDTAQEAQEKSPKRTHAIAAGLSPDLPNVLLTRLSEADLKNAGYAIKTALAKTPDDASFAWPAAPSRQQALFEVRFVPGASQGCRRYIVTVTKDRWTSTSAALEKCGAASPHAG